MKYPYQFEYRVAFRDVDLHGVLHHSNYLYYCERSRIDLLRSEDLNYNRVMDMGIALMLVEIKFKFIAPVKFDEILKINVGAEDIGKTSFKIRYSIEVEEKNVCEGYTQHVCVDLDSGKPKKIPEQLRNMFERVLVEESC